MPVNERFMSIGDWSLTLSPQTPKSVRDQITTPFAHVVVTPTRIDSTRVNDAGMLAASRYVGVVHRPGPQYDLGGAGLAWWLGDASQQGTIRGQTIVEINSLTFESALTGLLDGSYGYDSINPGAIEALGGTMARSWYYTTVRQMIDDTCRFFDAEWRIRNNFTLDAGRFNYIYGDDPSTLIVKRSAGKEPTLNSYEGDVGVSVDYSDYYNAVVFTTGTGVVYEGSAIANTWRDGVGDLVLRTLHVDDPNLWPGRELDVLREHLALHDSLDGRRDVTLNSTSYDIRGGVEPGSRIYVYDPDVDLVDPFNERRYGGSPIWPTEVRLVEMTWPVEAGMGVYYRTMTGPSTAVYVDLSDYVVHEAPGATLVVRSGGDRLRESWGLTDPAVVASTRADALAWTKYTPAWTSGGTAPVLGNGSVVAAYRRRGSDLSMRGQLTVGSTSTVGTGELRVAVPSGFGSTAAQIQAACAAFWFDASAGAVYPGVALLESSVGHLNFVFSGRPAEARFPSSALAAGDVVGWGSGTEIA